jgi:ATP-binding cassette subfamily F protein uup
VVVKKKRLQLLTILFRNPNFLILDEPTNDLDLPTLGVLENFLAEFQGCLVLVSHDRYFMDRLVDHLFVFEGDGVIKDFPGNYSQFRESIVNGQQSAEKVIDQEQPAVSREQLTTDKKRQLTFKEKREFETLEREIAELTKEKELVDLRLNSGHESFEELQKLSNRIGEIAELLDKKEMRWLELSELVV